MTIENLNVLRVDSWLKDLIRFSFLNHVSMQKMCRKKSDQNFVLNVLFELDTCFGDAFFTRTTLDVVINFTTHQIDTKWWYASFTPILLSLRCTLHATDSLFSFIIHIRHAWWMVSSCWSGLFFLVDLLPFRSFNITLSCLNEADGRKDVFAVDVNLIKMY